MPNTKYCVYCGKPLDSTGKKSKEHVIQNALGGMLTSIEICCNECNNLVSKMIDVPFTKYFAPFLNYIPNFSKTNKKKSTPVYPVIVEYNEKQYEGVAKNGKLIECQELCRELHKNLCDISPFPRIIGIKYPLSNKSYKNGMCKIAFNFALYEEVNASELKHGLSIGQEKGKITTIEFNYPVIPFCPMNCFDEALEFFEPMKLFHGMILFNDKNDLWCYVDLFNTFQVYVHLSDHWDKSKPLYKEYFQYFQKRDRSTDEIDLSGITTAKDIYCIATQYHVKPTIDINELKARIKKRIQKESNHIKLAKLMQTIFDSQNLANPEIDSIDFKLKEYYRNLGFLFDDDGDLKEDLFRARTLSDSKDLYEEVVSYPRYILDKTTHIGNILIDYPTLREYTYRKFYRLFNYLKV